MIPPHIAEWAHSPGPRRVLDALRQRAERGRLGVRGTVDVALSQAERREVGRLLPAAWSTDTDHVPVAGLRKALAVHGVDLTDLLVEIGGPLRDLPAERRETRERLQADASSAASQLRRLDPRVPGMVIERCLVGSADRPARASAIAGVVAAMTIEGERLAVLAARLFGDAHALDRSRPLGRAVARFLSGAAAGVDADGATSWQDPVADSAAWREAWASRGIVCDGVSAQVLALNLPLTGQAPAVALASVAGEPVWLTLRSLCGEFALRSDAADVFVCENPSIVEATADRFGVSSRPLICTFGVPSQAAIELVTVVAKHATVHVRADGDTVGHRIVTGLLRIPNTVPWRFPTGCAVYEEEILADLLSDLGPIGNRPHTGVSTAPA